MTATLTARTASALVRRAIGSGRASASSLAPSAVRVVVHGQADPTQDREVLARAVVAAAVQAGYDASRSGVVVTIVADEAADEALAAAIYAEDPRDAALAAPELRPDGNVLIDPRTPRTAEAHADAIAEAFATRRAAEAPAPTLPGVDAAIVEAELATDEGIETVPARTLEAGDVVVDTKRGNGLVGIVRRAQLVNGRVELTYAGAAPGDVVTYEPDYTLGRRAPMTTDERVWSAIAIDRDNAEVADRVVAHYVTIAVDNRADDLEEYLGDVRAYRDEIVDEVVATADDMGLNGDADRHAAIVRAAEAFIADARHHVTAEVARRNGDPIAAACAARTCTVDDAHTDACASFSPAAKRARRQRVYGLITR